MKKTLKNRNLLRGGAVLLVMALWILMPFILNDRVAQAEVLGETRIPATLSGNAINGVAPAGFSEYRQEDDGRRRLSVQASSVNLPAGTVLNVSVNNAAVGQMTVDGFRNAFFNVDTNNGQNVPVINIGMPISITQGGTIILSGTFGTVTPTPSPSGSPSASPSPSVSPTVNPTASPTVSPTVSPTASPTASPSPSVSPSPSPGGTGDLVAALTGATVNGVLPNGFAQYEIHSSRRELEIRINQINLPNGSMLTVAVNNAVVGQMSVSSNEARLRLRSDNGQNVPNVVSGDTITIQNNGATILSGVFNGGSGTPNPSPTPSGLGRYFETHLTGSQMTPPVATAANGEVKVFLNSNETQATITGEFHNLSSAQTGARIETTLGTPVTIHSFNVIGGANGNFAAATITVTPQQIQQLRAGLWSAVITSVNHPNGEIRGRLTQHSNGNDFDGDGSNDFAVFRPSNGAWYTLNTQGFGAQIHGNANDKLVSADFDGDGKTDAAVFKNVNGNGVWEIKRSSDAGITVYQFGLATDIPMRGDFDGDGRFDYAVYRPSAGSWYVQRSSDGAFVGVQFGAAEDKPLAGDFDGDGKSDFVVFRPSSGAWYVLRSFDNSLQAGVFGMNGDLPISGDFDGDGSNDFAVFRPSNGAWYILRSSDNGFQAAQFGTNGDIPVSGNYDGDDKSDLVVFRPSSGFWYILRSSDGGFQATQFGTIGDIPVIAR